MSRRHRKAALKLGELSVRRLGDDTVLEAEVHEKDRVLVRKNYRKQPESNEPDGFLFLHIRVGLWKNEHENGTTFEGNLLGTRLSIRKKTSRKSGEPEYVILLNQRRKKKPGNTAKTSGSGQLE